MPSLAFEACPRFSDTGEGAAECATTDAPLFHDEPDGDKIRIFLKRFAAHGQRRGQLWLLAGGPGGTGALLEGQGDTLAALLPDLDIYIPDHRGVRNSTPLECEIGPDATSDDVTACGAGLLATWGDRLAGFRTTEAARDVASLIRQTRTSADRVFVHGASYGGYWLHRLLAVEPGLLDAAVIESSSRAIMTDGVVGLARGPEDAGRRLFELCVADAQCRLRLGDDPYARALATVDGEVCPRVASVERETLCSIMVDALGSSQLRQTIPAFFHRAERCSAADQAWIGAFIRTIAFDDDTSIEQADPEFNWALSLHVRFSEMVGAYDPQALDLVVNGSLFADSAADRGLAEASMEWPAYGPDEFTDQWANVTLPVLVMHGGLDATTPISWGREIADNIGPSTQFVDFPWARHGVQGWPMGMNCGQNIMVQFLADPEQLDLSCIDAAPAFQFAPDPAWLVQQFGSDDLWGD